MKIYIYIVILSIFFTSISQAQRLEIGGGLGFTNYQGDLADAIFVAKEAKLSLSAHVKYALTPKFAIRANLLLGKIAGDDANSDDPSTISRGWKFNSPLTEIGIMGEYRILGKEFYNTAGEFLPSFSPYIFTGIGFTSVPGNPTSTTAVNPFPEPNAKHSFTSFPIGLGLRYHFTDFLVMGIEYGQRYVFSDYLDGVAALGNPNANDWYMYGNIQISYVISKGANYLNK
jgi:OmpA-OmpF porin, OOP family